MTELKTAYNGVYVGVIVDGPAGSTGQWVVVPRLNGDAMVRVVATCDKTLTADQAVYVATLSGLKDQLGVIGVVDKSEPSPGP